MSELSIILKTSPSYSPYKEVDLTGKAELIEVSPVDLDGKHDDVWGNLNRYKRGMKRRYRVNCDTLPDADVRQLRAWMHNRQRITVNGNYNQNTVLFQRFNRKHPFTNLPGNYIGPEPTFDRDINPSASDDQYPTYLDEDNMLHLMKDDDIPRYENATPYPLPYGLRGIRIDPTQVNYYGYSRPRSAGLYWDLIGDGGDGGSPSGSAAWWWEADEDPNIVGETGVGSFSGLAGDYIWKTTSSLAPSIAVSIFVWARGEGSVKLVAEETAGDKSGSNVSLDPSWQQVKVENVAVTSGGTIKIRFECNGAVEVHISCWQLSKYPRCTSYIDNMSGTASYATEVDGLHYDVQIPHIEGTVMVALRTPDLLQESGNYSPVFNFYSSGSEYFGLRYDATLAKWVFRKRSASYQCEWTGNPGEDTIIAVGWNRNILIAYERSYGTGDYKDQVDMGTNFMSLGKGLQIGSDDNNNLRGLNSQIYAIRMDRGFYDENEFERFAKSFYDNLTRLWNSTFEGREFEIRTPENKVEAAINRNRFMLQETYSDPCSTNEDF